MSNAGSSQMAGTYRLLEAYATKQPITRMPRRLEAYATMLPITRITRRLEAYATGYATVLSPGEFR